MVKAFLGIAILSEIALLVYCFVRKSRSRLEARIWCLAQAAAIALYYLVSPHSMMFQWFMLFVLMFIFTAFGTFGVIKYIRKKDDAPFKKGKVIGRTILKSFLWLFAIVPLLIFPPYKELPTTGSYTDIGTKTYTWTDESRVETLDNSGSKRNVTVTFYYPEEATEKCPLVIFSHGAFGFEKSNYSSYAELVSNGYIVASISHTYHAFFTKETDGTTKIVNTDFIQEAVDATNGEYAIEDEYQLTKKWMEVRMGDANFILDTIIKNCNDGKDEFFSKIDLEHIGAYGHSMGGATAVELGRTRDEIDAVVVLDGTFLGMYTGVENGVCTFIQDEYQKPLLNMIAMDHYDNTVKYTEEDRHVYVNMYTVEHAKIGKNVVIEGTGHMNFTDLPVFSPFLAGMLGTGERDSREAIEITNDCVREWFDCYLKNDGNYIPHIKDVY